MKTDEDYPPRTSMSCNILSDEQFSQKKSAWTELLIIIAMILVWSATCFIGGIIADKRGWFVDPPGGTQAEGK